MEIKIPSGIPVFVPVSAVKSIAAILEQVEKLMDCPRVFSNPSASQLKIKNSST